ncbi:MAG: tRNA (5-methylaminomethyl-2-thiouridine)(34)-methyltransferase MnmD [Flavobacteriaceae bacterium]|nr:tRNA (5-methylaminomethyl-2-thiouridine)(34)-methyltransferase MnmD [Flavobacteriaceae bacterium]
MKRKIIITDDGSSSLELLDVKEQYHSTFGAIQEAQFVYLKNGLKHFINCHNAKSISVLEMGFGTGLNAFLTFLLSEEERININYTGIEAFPLNADEVSQLNYVEQLKVKEYASVFGRFHNIKHNKQIQITPNFRLTLNTGSIEEYEALPQFDVIYFDAFGPAIQPELWTIAIFKKMYNCLLPQGVLVTYSAKGQVRRNMQKVGFKVERLTGPPGKREMLRATKP